ncbi:regulatory iron-sulfur-containing complex subunit RicT [Bacteroides sp.]|uniref:regulatory iron-sulfur-containing complex subunit RicT n=1 Tax=Bacteroides sp. TaxID=29523 RepID=UPI001B76A9BF|nr:regulatory iron-sulfur-containing complex subunit RicT [Bacteroides sp.]MBP6065973.1 hypothetical protein [Bacteroides sp.]MBP6067990.1 hypothetical protein [Bacteroides sp.]MBP6937109.1 hypothetical protein [Bacteroides sp.]MBP8622501.1 hypothetical protein [Bacteroides sp.]MBP9506536.1 hypothetical protein [Bacteroides sp.]
MDFKLHNGSGKLCCKGCSRQDKKLNTYDWLADIPGNAEESEMVEVQFKNTRKGFYRNSNKIKLEKGDIIAVEATPGHDIGVVTLTGRMVPLQMKKTNVKPDAEIKRIYRKVKPVDIEKYDEAKAKEHTTMIRARQIALDLGLNMKIGDVEYQGDGNKAIFYYIADERVDFRQLIKVLADAFRVRIEMKQIGARQEAGRIGGIGPCGRELCCATWMTSFVSVSTSAARFQDISLNPQKLAGQCAKLKCCLNYEVDGYVEAQKRLPSREIELETKDGFFYFFKADILANQISYSTDRHFPANLVTISGRRAFEIIGMNKKGIKPDSLLEEQEKPEPKKSIDLLEQESLTRFDRDRRRKEGGSREGGNREGGEGGANRNRKKRKANSNRPTQEGSGEGERVQATERRNSAERTGSRDRNSGGERNRNERGRNERNRTERDGNEGGSNEKGGNSGERSEKRNRPSRPENRTAQQPSSNSGESPSPQRPRNDRPRSNNQTPRPPRNSENNRPEKPQKDESSTKE